MKRALAAWLVWCALAQAPGPAWARPGTVSHVSDGDTLWWRPASGGRPLKVRLAGIDAPESCQAWGPQARQALAALVLHQTVDLEDGPRDAHGRRLARLWRGRVDVGRQMVAQGHAWSHRWHRDPGPYAAEQEQAQRTRQGLFQDPQALPPREFRRRFGACPRPATP